MPPKSLQGFVNRKGGASPSDEPLSPQIDRHALAKGIKINTRKSSKPISSGHHLTSTAPPAAPAYNTNPIADRNYIPNHQSSHYNGASNVEKDPFDVTETDIDLTSQFDETGPHERSAPESNGHNHAHRQENDGYPEDGVEDDTYAQTGANQAEGYNGNGHGIQKLAHHSRRSPNPDDNTMGPPQSHALFSRFTASQHGQKAPPQNDVAIAPSKPRQVPILHSRSEEDPHGQPTLRRHDTFDISDQANGRNQEVDKQNGLDGSVVDDLESPTDDEAQHDPEYAPGPWPYGIDQTPYYEKEELEKMDYEVLKKEEWDSDLPRKRSLESDSQKIAPLKERLLEVLDKEIVIAEGLSAKDEEAAEQAATFEINQLQFNFFKSLPIEDWESCGSMLIDRMAEIMKQMTAARHAKRKLVADFETRIEKREILVRGKSEHIEAQFEDMRKNGKGLLRGKSS